MLITKKNLYLLLNFYVVPFNIFVLGSGIEIPYIYIEKGTNIRHVLHQALSISALPEHPFLGMTQWRRW